ncbi:hypothetical protein LY474_20670 [Myxococcus stipitatus]|uniref:hypothetical protein n=1 Tax=Myxococcus stipitatus TaxID=83455 RepID=UPI001F3AF561|nr:hypothetical protein [Myxococcus stipitatus]MCE9670215.1 hypothetical protein [Myxococcus stipitatus]
MVLPGAIAGLCGALVMMALAMPLGALSRGDVWYAARLAAGLFLRSTPDGGGAVVLGLLVHVATAGGLATTFALLLPRGGTAVAALFLGLMVALGLQAIMPSLVVPFASPPLARQAPQGAFLLLHLAFGAALALVVPMRRLSTLVARSRRRGSRGPRR